MSETKDFSEFEFSAGSINGLRAFKVDSLGRLTGVTHEMVWQPGENVANCDRSGASIKYDPSTLGVSQAAYAAMMRGLEKPTGQRPQHDIPHATCGCGFWAFYDGTNEFAGRGTVSAVVEGYGRTIIGSKGFRSEKAKILALSYVDVAETVPARRERRSQWRKRYALGLGWRWGVVFFVSVFAMFAGLAENWFGMALNTGLAMWNGYYAIAYGARQWRGYVAKSCPVEVRWPMLHAEEWINGKCPCSKADWDVPYTGAHRIDPELAARLRRNYPDVPVFRTVAAMTKAFPVQAPPRVEITPENVEDFWTRSAS